MKCLAKIQQNLKNQTAQNQQIRWLQPNQECSYQGHKVMYRSERSIIISLIKMTTRCLFKVSVLGGYHPFL